MNISGDFEPLNMLGYKDFISPSDDIAIHIINYRTFKHYREVFLSKKVIAPSSGMMGKNFYLGLSSNLRFFGFVAISEMPHSPGECEEFLLLCDFVISSAQKRLSKLVIMCLATKELFDFVGGYQNKNIKRLKTIVYTDKPASMKYRGMYQLERRHEDRLVYVTGPKYRLDAVLPIWFKKYGGTNK